MLNEYEKLQAEQAVHTLALRFLIAEVSALLKANGKDLPTMLSAHLAKPLSPEESEGIDPGQFAEIHQHQQEYLSCSAENTLDAII